MIQARAAAAWEAPAATALLRVKATAIREMKAAAKIQEETKRNLNFP